jgi:DNA-binding NarL/FixJ family response regulator
VTTVAPRGEIRARVLIAADHVATRTGMRLALAGSAECSEAEDANSAIEAALRHRPDVCVVDFIPAGRGIQAAAEITSMLPEAAVVVMTERLDEDEFLAAVRAGASGYVLEGIDPLRLPHMIRSILRGEAAVPRSLVPRLIDEFRGRERRRKLMIKGGRPVELTSREWDVVEALRRGLTTRETATLLSISEVTVRRHVSTVHRKVGVTSRRQLLQLLEELPT